MFTILAIIGILFILHDLRKAEENTPENRSIMEENERLEYQLNRPSADYEPSAD